MRSALICLFISSSFLTSPAQQIPMTQPTMSTLTIIDGAEHPELISDNTAFRLWFVVASTNSSPTASQVENQNRQFKSLESAGICEQDRAVLKSTLSSFRSEYEQIIRLYNDSVETEKSFEELQGKLSRFLHQRDQLVDATRGRLKRELTAEGNSKLERFVQFEKRNMKITSR